ncbi:alpha/beta hydrolase [Terriglobus saanensis]|uniref:Alpha/beta hydrolase domain-containing protein n=1 Tax=Terriglobus saanensis (strain ATCC BAA-1853 / DSM 23119 / SP1PR4) TaxID=401053 RepID=E8UXT0_TERSS|nr:alpha/beta hydrolase [Terriglobus saanensis]ADV83096.1 alpha/beta hydrolase domain-containing protein [Terriglobus saanensis SP1PR4]
MGKLSRALGVGVYVSLVAAASIFAPAQSTAGSVRPDGTVVINDLPVPISSSLSPEAHAYMLHLLVDKPFSEGPSESDIKALRAFQDKIMNGFLQPIRSRYQVDIEHKTVAGVYTDIVTPSDGIAPKNKDKVLLNVHGGGFITGARTAGLVESVPIAAIEKIKVVTINYRMGPEFKFPAASEDVAAVYAEILKEYSPQHIGLYGCSAGGMLTGMSIAWFHAHHLPNPAAVGVLCAGLGEMFVGDAPRLAGPLNGMSTPGASANKTGGPRPTLAYLSNANSKDPLVYPLNSTLLLARFPPTLFVTSTRGFEFSSVLEADNALVRQGIETELHVWDGLPHAFWYNSSLPESREVYDVIARFFDSHLSK